MWTAQHEILIGLSSDYGQLWRIAMMKTIIQSPKNNNEDQSKLFQRQSQSDSNSGSHDKIIEWPSYYCIMIKSCEIIIYFPTSKKKCDSWCHEFNKLSWCHWH